MKTTKTFPSWMYPVKFSSNRHDTLGDDVFLNYRTERETSVPILLCYHGENINCATSLEQLFDVQHRLFRIHNTEMWNRWWTPVIVTRPSTGPSWHHYKFRRNQVQHDGFTAMSSSTDLFRLPLTCCTGREDSCDGSTPGYIVCPVPGGILAPLLVTTMPPGAGRFCRSAACLRGAGWDWKAGTNIVMVLPGLAGTKVTGTDCWSEKQTVIMTWSYRTTRLCSTRRVGILSEMAENSRLSNKRKNSPVEDCRLSLQYNLSMTSSWLRASPKCNGCQEYSTIHSRNISSEAHSCRSILAARYVFNRVPIFARTKAGT